MRDRADNAVIVCSIENLDPMGVHTGDSITVAPIQTLSDPEYQAMRDEGITCLRAIGVETGRVECPVRRRPGDRTEAGDRGEPAGVALLGARLEGNRVPHRQDRRPARRRLHPRRDHQRHHRRHSGVVRAGTRLRRGQGATVRLRQVPGGAAGAGNDDALGGGGDGHRTDIPRGAAKGIAEPGDGPGRAQRRPRRGGADRALERAISTTPSRTPTPDRVFAVGEALRRGCAVEDVAAASGYDPWFVDQIGEIVESAGLAGSIRSRAPS